MVKILNAIVHQLDLSGNSAILSNNILELSANNEVIAFFENHIMNSRNDSKIKACSFKNGSYNMVRNISGEINKVLQGFQTNLITEKEYEEIFIDSSKNLTNQLRLYMEQRSRSDGSLFVFIYELEGEKYLAILKMDPNDGVKVAVNESTGNLEVSLIKNMLPGIKEKLHKCAFIRLMDSYDNNNVHVLALDKQKGTSEPAKFFMEDFLQVVEKANDKNLTTAVCQSIVEVFLPIIPEAKRTQFKLHVIDRMSTSRTFNLDNEIENMLLTFVEKNFLDEFDMSYETSKVKKAVTEKYTDAVFEFTPNPEELRNIIYKSEDGKVKLTVDPKNSLDVIFEPDIDDDYYIVKISKDKINMRQI